MVRRQTTIETLHDLEEEERGEGDELEKEKTENEKDGVSPLEEARYLPRDIEPSLGQPKKSKKIELSCFSSFVPKPLPLSSSSPLIVFINPKSGGNQGAKLMQK